jgi:hypothetical protein
MSVTAHPGVRPLPAVGVAAALRRHAARIALVCGYVLVLLAALPQELVQDSWLTLLGGREIADHGLPTTDGLTVWTHGVRWVDQQWLAQVVFFRLHELGGIRLVMLFHVALLTAAFACAVAAARASTRSVVLVGVGTAFVAPWALQMRAQSFAFPLFAAVLWLLVADARSPSRRVFLVLPLLVLWANLHGTALFGGMLVVLRGLVYAWERRPARAAALVVLPPLCLLASPYGLDLPGYYRALLLNPRMHWFIDEWRPGAPSQKTALFYLLCAVAIWLVARHGRVLTAFERLALAATLLNGLLAVRSIPWFGVTCLIVLPAVVDEALATRSVRRPRLALAVGSLAVALAATGAAAARPASWYTRLWPDAPAERVAALAQQDPSALVLSDDRYADWLLWAEPQLRGRVAYDVRFELFAGKQFDELFRYRNQVGDDWRRAQAGYDILALARPDEELVIRAVRGRDGYRLVYESGLIAVLQRR